MTFYEFIVPVGALAFAGLGILYIRWEDRRLDRKLHDEASKQSH